MYGCTATLSATAKLVNGTQREMAYIFREFEI